VGQWLNDHIEPIIFAVLATWFALTKWLVGKILHRQESRMLAIEQRQEQHEKELLQFRDKLADKMDEHYRVIDGKIDDIRNYLMTRERNQRKGDQ
jgi:hypothetical protein